MMNIITAINLLFTRAPVRSSPCHDRKIAINDLVILQTGAFIISDRSIPIFVACPFMGVFKKRR